MLFGEPSGGGIWLASVAPSLPEPGHAHWPALLRPPTGPASPRAHGRLRLQPNIRLLHPHPRLQSNQPPICEIDDIICIHKIDDYHTRNLDLPFFGNCVEMDSKKDSGNFLFNKNVRIWKIIEISCLPDISCSSQSKRIVLALSRFFQPIYKVDIYRHRNANLDVNRLRSTKRCCVPTGRCRCWRSCWTRASAMRAWPRSTASPPSATRTIESPRSSPFPGIFSRYLRFYSAGYSDVTLIYPVSSFTQRILCKTTSNLDRSKQERNH